MDQTCLIPNQNQDIISSSHVSTPNIPEVSETVDEGHFDGGDADYQEDYYEDDNDDDYEEEQEQERIRAFYNIRPKPKTVFSPQKQEELKERQQKLQQKKKEKLEEEQKTPPIQGQFAIIDEQPDEIMCFNKDKKLVHSTTGVKGYCYVPQKSLIFVMMEDSKNALVYSSVNFKIVKRLKFSKRITVVRYLEEYNKVFFGGEDFFIQTFNLCTFQVGLQSDLNPGHHVIDIVYLKKNKIAVSNTQREVNIMSTSLITLDRIGNLDTGTIGEMISLNNNFVLVTSDLTSSRNLFLYDLKTKTAHLSEISVYPNSCIDATSKGANKILTCLSRLPGTKPAHPKRVPIVQLALDAKNCKLLVHRTGPEDKAFSRLEKIQNSDCFVAIQPIDRTSKIVLVKICGDDFQLIKTLVQNNCYIGKPKMSFRLNDETMLCTDSHNGKEGSVYVCRVVTKKVTCKELEN